MATQVVVELGLPHYISTETISKIKREVTNAAHKVLADNAVGVYSFRVSEEIKEY